MAIMALREFECTLCQQQFTRFSGDLIVPGPRLCDACLQELWPLDDDALRERVSHQLAQHASSGDKGPEWQNGIEQLEDQVVQIVLNLKQSGRSIEEIVWKIL
jgi:hypothetical protein